MAEGLIEGIREIDISYAFSFRTGSRSKYGADETHNSSGWAGVASRSGIICVNGDELRV